MLSDAWELRTGISPQNQKTSQRNVYRVMNLENLLHLQWKKNTQTKLLKHIYKALNPSTSYRSNISDICVHKHLNDDFGEYFASSPFTNKYSKQTVIEWSLKECVLEWHIESTSVEGTFLVAKLLLSSVCSRLQGCQVEKASERVKKTFPQETLPPSSISKLWIFMT